MRPLIGITSSNHTNKHGWAYHAGYAANAQSIIRAGGLAVFLPAEMSDEITRATYERLDGVLLSGGGDVDPARYNEPADPLSKNIDARRDDIEIRLAQWAVADDRPLFGICRGHQVLNVALGGKLVQDVPTMVDTDIKHDIPFDEPRTNLVHTVTIEPGSKLLAAVGQPTVRVNSLHHQAVIEVGAGARVVARAEDGIIEGVELPDRFFALSVQWHPEDLTVNQPEAANLFEAFVAAARARMLTRQQTAR